MKCKEWIIIIFCCYCLLSAPMLFCFSLQLFHFLFPLFVDSLYVGLRFFSSSSLFLFHSYIPFYHTIALFSISLFAGIEPGILFTISSNDFSSTNAFIRFVYSDFKIKNTKQKKKMEEEIMKLHPLEHILSILRLKRIHSSNP